MKGLKKTAVVLLIVPCMIFFAACGNKPNDSPNPSTPPADSQFRTLDEYRTELAKVGALYDIDFVDSSLSTLSASVQAASTNNANPNFKMTITNSTTDVITTYIWDNNFAYRAFEEDGIISSKEYCAYNPISGLLEAYYYDFDSFEWIYSEFNYLDERDDDGNHPMNFAVTPPQMIYEFFNPKFYSTSTSLESNTQKGYEVKQTEKSGLIALGKKYFRGLEDDVEFESCSFIDYKTEIVLSLVFSNEFEQTATIAFGGQSIEIPQEALDSKIE